MNEDEINKEFSIYKRDIAQDKIEFIVPIINSSISDREKVKLIEDHIASYFVTIQTKAVELGMVDRVYYKPK